MIQSPYQNHGSRCLAKKEEDGVEVHHLQDVDDSFSFIQMANLGHRAGQLLEKQYLIIHPTADGNNDVWYIISQFCKKLKVNYLTVIGA